MEAKIYFAVKMICALVVFYRLWIFLFCHKIYGLWDKLHNWARIARVDYGSTERNEWLKKPSVKGVRKYTVRICLQISINQSKQKRLIR